MNTVLSVQGASAPVKKKSFFSKFTRLNMLLDLPLYFQTPVIT